MEWYAAARGMNHQDCAAARHVFGCYDQMQRRLLGFESFVMPINVFVAGRFDCRI
jgi:hypothetical protein